jgi:hypothetical protein
MQIISHRINTIKDLKNVDHSYGIEVDIRYHNNDIILHHDPFHCQENNGRSKAYKICFFY